MVQLLQKANTDLPTPGPGVIFYPLSEKLLFHIKHFQNV